MPGFTGVLSPDCNSLWVGSSMLAWMHPVCICARRRLTMQLTRRVVRYRVRVSDFCQ